MEQDDFVSAFLEAARAFRSALATDEVTEQPEFAREGRIRARLGPADSFVDVWDPTDRSRRVKTIERSLAQELVEIDEDLAHCVTWLEEPQEPDALWDVRFAFEEHWGKHAVDVLRPLHHIARGDVG